MADPSCPAYKLEESAQGLADRSLLIPRLPDSQRIPKCMATIQADSPKVAMGSLPTT